MGVCSVKDTRSMNYCPNLENEMTLFSIVRKKIGQITDLLICDGIDDTPMYM